MPMPYPYLDETWASSIPQTRSSQTSSYVLQLPAVDGLVSSYVNVHVDVEWAAKKKWQTRKKEA